MRTIQSIINYYGEPGTNMVYCKLPFVMRLAWDKDVTISRFSCHEKIQHQLEHLFEDVLACYGRKNISDLRLDLFGGCLNIRKKRRGNRLSLHSWGLAVDIDPVKNRLSWTDRKANLAQPEYNNFWASVKEHGFHSLGKQQNYDWMHFQAIHSEEY